MNLLWVWENLYTQEKEYQQAHNFYNNAKDGFDQGNFPDIQSELYKNISELYIAQGNALEGKRYQDLYSKAHQQLDGRIKKGRDAVMNEIMNHERIKHEAEVQQGKKYTVFIISIFVFITLLIVYLLKRANDKNYKTSKLTKQLRAEKLLQEKEKNILKLQLRESQEEIINLAKENNPRIFCKISTRLSSVQQQNAQNKPNFQNI